MGSEVRVLPVCGSSEPAKPGHNPESQEER